MLCVITYSNLYKLGLVHRLQLEQGVFYSEVKGATTIYPECSIDSRLSATLNKKECKKCILYQEAIWT